MMIVLHDDAQREYAYGPADGLPATNVGTFTQALYDEAKSKGWIVISMKHDWNHIFCLGEVRNRSSQVAFRPSPDRERSRSGHRAGSRLRASYNFRTAEQKLRAGMGSKGELWLDSVLR